MLWTLPATASPTWGGRRGTMQSHAYRDGNIPPMERPCVRPFFAFRALGVAGPRRSAASLIGEYVAEAQRVCQFHERGIVPRAGPHSLAPPAPDGFGMGVETAVQLRPRQGRLLLKPHEALQEVVGEVICPTAVVCALAQRRAGQDGPALRPSRWRTQTAGSPLYEWLRASALVSLEGVSPDREGIAGHFGPSSLKP